jgi:hypothetical protein
LHPFSSIRVVLTARLSRPTGRVCGRPVVFVSAVNTRARTAACAACFCGRKLPECKHPTLTGTRNAATTPASL